MRISSQISACEYFAKMPDHGTDEVTFRREVVMQRGNINAGSRDDIPGPQALEPLFPDSFAVSQEFALEKLPFPRAFQQQPGLFGSSLPPLFREHG